MRKLRLLPTVCSGLMCSVFFSYSASAEKCFASQQVPAQTVSNDQKAFSIKDEIRPCDGNNYQSSSITNFYVSVVRTQGSRLEVNIYFEINYHYYAGSMTWRGWQPNTVLECGKATIMFASAAIEP
jgi:hypothetical protein